MPYNARVYRVLIASPSDVEQEREVAVRVVQDWNDLHSYSRKVVLLPLRWETHTAPEYGTRPQEPINRAIVDNCDLLVGVFWTRLGTPSGEAESGTLEEIERVASAGKPVMLYFSQVEIDPYKIDSIQQARIKQFRESVSTKALVESYRSHLEFRDKLAKQIEIKIRDVHAADSEAQPPPLTLELFSVKERRLTTDASYEAEKIEVPDLDRYAPDSQNGQVGSRDRGDPASPTARPGFGLDRGSVLRIAEELNMQNMAVPLLLVVRNNSELPLHNIFMNVVIRPSSAVKTVSNRLEVLENIHFLSWTSNLLKKFKLEEATLDPCLPTRARSVLQELEPVLDEWREKDQLKQEDGVWSFSLKWDALQPQRRRLVEPIPFVIPVDNVNIQVEVRVFADNLPKQVALTASVSVTVKAREISALDLAFGSRSGAEKRSDALRAIRENKDPAFVAKRTRR